ncbi:5-oxoprolinase subunit PxpA [Pelagibacterium lacus]|uniref:LamB/YcsF family protein n=1 Tax=Pelagibacterium lacus TaxID=2282655 RepID=A0A369W3K4_9HYPH|nr:5-oxoprolinase subunit PxpA [Pelagibacterium lacus]RDE08619.1 LamB/YcsF family protein [Pelagibacterium lacus]
MIDLNADLGEGIADDAAMLAIVTSASIACGGHAGTAQTMRLAIRSALDNGVRIGAHPGFADPEHFGRLRLALPADTVRTQVLDQIAVLIAIADEEGAEVAYVKLHGALANMAAEDEGLARHIFAGIAARWPHMAVLALAASAQERAARAIGLPVIAEAYADRAYDADGLLVSRDVPGAVIEDPAAITARCLRLARQGEIVAIDGTILSTDARSICLHGDTPGALTLARTVREALETAGFIVPRAPHPLSLR